MWDNAGAGGQVQHFAPFTCAPNVAVDQGVPGGALILGEDHGGRRSASWSTGTGRTPDGGPVEQK